MITKICDTHGLEALVSGYGTHLWDCSDIAIQYLKTTKTLTSFFFFTCLFHTDKTKALKNTLHAF